jgi:hypothetical protein
MLYGTRVGVNRVGDQYLQGAIPNTAFAEIARPPKRRGTCRLLRTSLARHALPAHYPAHRLHIQKSLITILPIILIIYTILILILMHINKPETLSAHGRPRLKRGTSKIPSLLYVYIHAIMTRTKIGRNKLGAMHSYVPTSLHPPILFYHFLSLTHT